MIIGLTGTQKGMVQYQKDMTLEVFRLKSISEYACGDCIGSDKDGAIIAFEYGIKIFTLFPPTDFRKRAFLFNEEKILNHDNGQFRPIRFKDTDIQVRWMPRRPYLERNKLLVDYSAWMIATPKEHRLTMRSGTWATIRYIWRTKKDHTIIPPIVRED